MASILAMPLGIVALVASPKLSKKFGLMNVVRASLLIGAVLYGSLFAIMVLTTVNVWVYIIWSALAQGISGVSIYMQWGMVGEVIDYNEMVTEKRTEGSIYGTFNLTRRVGQTIGNSAAVLALGWIGYDTALADAGIAQAAGVLTGIKALCILVPAIFVLGSWAAFKFVWNITPETKEKMAAYKASKEA